VRRPDVIPPGTPAIRVRDPDEYGRTITDGVVAIEVRIVIPPRPVVIIGVTVRIVTPPRIARADEKRSGEMASAVAVAMPVAGAVIAACG
jgi:hypothetical protein